MSNRAENRWNARPVAEAVAMPYPTMFGAAAMHECLTIVRDTLIVLGMQLAFRATMFLRHLYY